MFGQDKNSKSSKDDTNDIPDESIHGVLNDTIQSDPSAPGVVQPPTVADPDPVAVAADDQSWQHPGQPIDTSTDTIKDVISPVGGYPRSTNDQVQHASGPVTSTLIAKPADMVPETPAIHKLIDIKQHALEELEPLIDQLDQEPPEKFRTIMMMLQASDDQDLVPKAYEIAHSIEDEKVRAQALLDIVNEINYFTQQPTPES